MDVLFAILLGIVQGITEFLPVSSSGHLIVVSSIFSGHPLPLHLNVGLHIGTLLAVFIFFWRDWWQLLVALFDDFFRGKKSFYSRVLFPSLIIGSVPAGVIGIFLQDRIEEMFHQSSFVAWPLIVVGIIIWWGDKTSKKGDRLETLSISTAFGIGCAQALALIPGVSRSGITILAARLAGFNRHDSARFCFLLGAPAMFGAALLNGSEIITSMNEREFIIGMLTSVVVGCLSIKFLLAVIERFGFGFFACYRIALGILILFLTTN